MVIRGMYPGISSCRITTLLRSAAISRTRPVAEQNTSVDPGKLPAVQWTTLFQNTYRTELRPESIDRAQMIVEADQQHYRIISQALADEPTIKTNWLLERWRGKTLSVLRLIKAAFTFQGGADYIAWKIKRHAGVDIKVTDFQRHHPLLAAITLLPQLIRKGAFR